MSLIFATQLTAIATAILAAFAIITAWYARRAFLKQSQEVSDQGEMLKVQSEKLDEQRNINAEQTRVLSLQARELQASLDQRRRAQAAQVFIVIEGSENREGRITLTATARNTSQLPVYDLWVRWRTGRGEFGAPSVAPLFLPAETKASEVIWTEAAGMSGTGVSLDFRDAAGVHWRTTDRGVLTELCGTASQSLADNRCTFAPKHDGPHSWEQTGNPA